MDKTLLLLLALCSTGLLNAGESNSKMAGWTVSAATLNESQLGILESTLKDLNDIFPPKALAILHQRISIQVDGNEQRPKSGVIKTGYYDGVGAVHLVSSRDCGNKILLVHELSHASQKLAIGMDNVRVKQAYQEVVEKNLYPKTAYLTTNHKEYFAEMSVVYLFRLHYFPHDRETLSKHDPTSYKLMEDFWGKLDDKSKAASGNDQGNKSPQKAMQETVKEKAGSDQSSKPILVEIRIRRNGTWISHRISYKDDKTYITRTDGSEVELKKKGQVLTFVTLRRTPFSFDMAERKTSSDEPIELIYK